MCDPATSSDLAETALILVKRLASNGQLNRLNEFVRKSEPTSRVAKAVVSAVIKRFLEEGFWSIEDAVRHAPEPHDEVLDSTHLLETAFIEEMTVPAARIVIERMLPTTLNSTGKIDSQERPNLLSRAVSLLLEQDPPLDHDLDTLLPLAIRNWELGPYMRFNFGPAFSKSESARRKLYAADLQHHREQQPAATARSYRWFLQPDDVDWLIDQLPALAADDDSVWDDLLITAKQGGEEMWERAKQFVRKHRPSVVDQFEEGLVRHKLSDGERQLHKKSEADW